MLVAQALVVSYQCHGTFRKSLEVVTKFIVLLNEFKITPVLIFDGSPLPAKHAENDRSKRVREEQARKAEALEEQGNTSEARKVRAQSATVAFAEIMGLIKVLFKLDRNGGADMLELSKVLNHLQMELRSFQTMCIVAGRDYLKNIRGIGIKQAKEIVSNNDHEDIPSKNPNAPPG